jgi:hypothetical protein
MSIGFAVITLTTLAPVASSVAGGTAFIVGARKSNMPPKSKGGTNSERCFQVYRAIVIIILFE